MNAHRIHALTRLAMITFLGLGLLSSAQGAGTVWVSDTFGRSGDRVGQFADRGQGKWDQVLKNRKRLHTYSQTAVTDQYVELSGSGGVVRLYANQALHQRGSRWNPMANGSFSGGSPLQAGVVTDPPVVTPPPATAGPVDTRGIVWASSSLGQPGDKIGGFVSHGNGKWDQAMINGQKVHSYRQTTITTEYVELQGSGGKIRLYGDHAEMKKGFRWEPWTYGSFRSDIRIPIPSTPPGTTTTIVTTPNPPVVAPAPATGNAGILWVPNTLGQRGEQIGQFVGRGNGKWDQLMKNGKRVRSYRETATTAEYVELSGSGETVRLYGGMALLERGPSRRTWTYGGFQNGNPLQGSTSGSSPWRY